MIYPECRLDLLHYWSKLEQLHIDPVLEFNKSFDHFFMSYRPMLSEVFAIVVQACRFFKDFADFENSKTPSYRHPFLKGQELTEINLLDEIKNFDRMYSEQTIPAIEEDENFNAENAVKRKIIRDQIFDNIEGQKQKEVIQNSELTYYYYKR